MANQGSGISSDCYIEYINVSSAQPEVVPDLAVIIMPHTSGGISNIMLDRIICQVLNLFFMKGKTMQQPQRRIRLNTELRNKISNRMRVHLEARGHARKKKVS